MSGILEGYAFKRLELTVATDANTTASVNISGYQVVAVIMPGTLDGATNDITFDIDPGDGTFRIFRNDSGAAYTLSNVVANEHWLATTQPVFIVGARLRLQLSEDEDADRVFLVQLVKLPT